MTEDVFLDSEWTLPASVPGLQDAKGIQINVPRKRSDQVMFAMFNDMFMMLQWYTMMFMFPLKFVAEILLDAQDSQKVENFRRLSTRTSIEYQYTVYTVYQCLPSQYSGRFWMLMTGCFTSWCTKGGGEAKLWLNPRFPYHGAVSVKTYAWSNWCFSFCSGRQGKKSRD